MTTVTAANPQVALAEAQAKLAADQAAKAAANIITTDQLAVTEATKAAETSTQNTGLVNITV